MPTTYSGGVNVDYAFMCAQDRICEDRRKTVQNRIFRLRPEYGRNPDGPDPVRADVPDNSLRAGEMIGWTHTSLQDIIS